MITLELTLNLPDRLAREAESAGLLKSAAISRLLKDAIRQRAAQALLDGAARATRSGSKPMSMRQIQAEVDAERRALKILEKSGGNIAEDQVVRDLQQKRHSGKAHANLAAFRRIAQTQGR